MKVAYLSPLYPDQSGIADFSEELVQELKAYMDIDLFYDTVPEHPEIFWNFNCYPMEELERQDVREQYDLLVYQLGNNIVYHRKIMELALKYPGVVEIHDYCMGDAAIAFCGSREKALKWTEYSEGVEIRNKLEYSFDHSEETPIWQANPETIPLVRKFVENARGVIVHSETNEKKIRNIASGVPVERIYLHSAGISDDIDKCKEEARIELSLTKEQKVFGSFGYVTESKRVHVVLRALGRYKNEFKKDDFIYCIVGGVAPEIDLNEIIKENELEENVLMTGFVDLNTFKQYMQACDFCINLRYPSHGETSASLHRMLGYGKEVLVTALDTFVEYPDEFAVKIPYGEKEEEKLYEKLKELLSDTADYEENGRKAWKYAKDNFNIELNAKTYADFFEKLMHHNIILKDLFVTSQEVGMGNKQYIDHLTQTMRDFFA